MYILLPIKKFKKKKKKGIFNEDGPRKALVLAVAFSFELLGFYPISNCFRV
jgi:hypothetical protein